MMTDQITKKEIKIVNYQGKGYTLRIASNWTVKKLQENQTAFLGPKIGALSIGFYVTVLLKKGKNYIDAARISKASQSKQTDYILLEEKDISQENFKGFIRRSSWFNADKDMMVFVREIFTETDTEVFILSSIIPNSSDLAELDNTIVAMMNSFRFTNK